MNPKESVNTTPSLFSLCSNRATVSFPLVAASVNTAVLRMGEGHSQLCLAPLKWKPTGSLWEAWQRRHVKHSHRRTQSRGPVHLTGVRDRTCHARAACGAVRLRDSWSVKGEDQILPERSRSTGSHANPGHWPRHRGLMRSHMKPFDHTRHQLSRSALWTLTRNGKHLPVLSDLAGFDRLPILARERGFDFSHRLRALWPLCSVVF